MIGYASRTGTRRNLDALRAAGWHLLVSATGCLRHEDFEYAIDNGAWTAHQQGHPIDLVKFGKALTKLGAGAKWVALPDIVEGGRRSLDLSLAWRDRVLDAAPRALLPVQDGIVPADVRNELSDRVGIFVGGSSEWKESTLSQWSTLAADLGVWCHVARVNTARRIALCAAAGATSFDGTSATRYAKSLPALDAARRQLAIADLTAPRAKPERKPPRPKAPVEASRQLALL